MLPLLPSWLQSPGVERASAISALLQLIWPTLRAALEADVLRAANAGVAGLMARLKVCVWHSCCDQLTGSGEVWHEVFVQFTLEEYC